MQRAADRAWNADQRLEPGQSGTDSHCDYVRQLGSAAHCHRPAGNRDVGKRTVGEADHHAGDAFVAHQHIRSAAEQPNLHSFVVAPFDHGPQLVRRGRFGEILRSPAQLEPGPLGKRHLLADARNSGHCCHIRCLGVTPPNVDGNAGKASIENAGLSYFTTIPLAKRFVRGHRHAVREVQAANVAADRNPQPPVRMLFQERVRQAVRLAAENQHVARLKAGFQIRSFGLLREQPRPGRREVPLRVPPNHPPLPSANAPNNRAQLAADDSRRHESRAAESATASPPPRHKSDRRCRCCTESPAGGGQRAAAVRTWQAWRRLGAAKLSGL